MSNLKHKLISILDQLRGRAIHAAWLGVIALTCVSIEVSELTVWAGLAAAALPGLLGVLLAGPDKTRIDTVRLALALAWVLPGVCATLGFGTPVSLAALVFLAGPAAMAAAGGREDARLGAVMSALAFVLLYGAGRFGPVGAELAVFTQSAEPWAGFAAFLAFCGLVSRARMDHQLGKVSAALNVARPAAEGFARAPSPLVALNHAGEVTAASKSIRRLTPGAPRDLAGLGFDGLAFDEDERDSVRAGLAEAQTGGGAEGGQFTFQVRGAKGEARSIDARAVATPTGFVLCLERSGQANAETSTGEHTPQTVQTPAINSAISPVEIETLERERDDAIAANRSKSEFLAAVSHELRTPLNAIIGFSDVMKQRLFGPLPARYAEYGDLIHESGTHLLDLIGDVLDMSKIEADRYELTTDHFDARDVVDISTKMMRLNAEEHGLELYSDTGTDAIPVEADRKAMRQILLNLLSNAVKFTPQGGAIVVMARGEGRDLVLAVGDSGVGMSAEEVERIGQPYSQAESAKTTSERGTGLGLALVRSLTELQGGSMHVKSAPDQGTTVTVRLPVLEQPTGELAPFQPLEVHERIRAAQTAGQELADSQMNTQASA